MMKPLFTFLLFGALTVLMSCQEAIDWQIKEGEVPKLVVEGMVTNEFSRHSVRLSLPMSDPDEKPLAVSDAKIVISDGQNTYLLIESEQRDGVYRLMEPFQGVINREYHLQILHQGEVYQAKSRMVPVTLLNQPVYNKHPEEQLYEYVPGKSTEPAMEEIILDWSEVEGYTQLPKAKTKARLFFYTLESLDVNQLFAPRQDKVWFPAGTSIHRKKYSLTEEQQIFIRSRLMETEWRGGLFDVAKGNVKTNLSNGAVGYFAAVTVVSDFGIVRP